MDASLSPVAPGALSRRSRIFSHLFDRVSGLVLVTVMSAAMWAIELANHLDHQALDRYGIEPRSEVGLRGVLTAPFLHVSYQHLVGNTVPFLVCGALIALSGAGRVLAVTAAVALLGGLGTWAIAPAHTDTVGASGLIFGYIAYLVARGLWSRKPWHALLGLAVGVFYGSALYVGLEPHAGISWQGHLCGGMAGVLAARFIHRRERRKALAAKEQAALVPGL